MNSTSITQHTKKSHQHNINKIVTQQTVTFSNPDNIKDFRMRQKQNNMRQNRFWYNNFKQIEDSFIKQ